MPPPDMGEKLSPEDMRKGLVVYWEESGRKPIKVQITNAKKTPWKTTAIQFEHNLFGTPLIATREVEKTTDTFYRVKSPISKKEIEEIGLDLVPEVGPTYFEAKSRFEESKKRAGTRKRRKRKSKTRRYFKGI